MQIKWLIVPSSIVPGSLPTTMSPATISLVNRPSKSIDHWIMKEFHHWHFIEWIGVQSIRPMSWFCGRQRALCHQSQQSITQNYVIDLIAPAGPISSRVNLIQFDFWFHLSWLTSQSELMSDLIWLGFYEVDTAAVTIAGDCRGFSGILGDAQGFF